MPRFAFALVLFAAPLLLSAQTFTYTFSDVTTGSGLSSPGGEMAELSFSSFTAAGLSDNSNAAGVFAFRDWDTGASNGSDAFSGSLNTAKYYEFTVTPGDGFSYTLTTLAFSAGRTSTGPRQFVVRASHDGFSANLPGTATAPVALSSDVFQFTDNGSTNLISGQSVTLGGDAFSDLTMPTTFRFYALDSESTVGAFRLDNVSIYATTAATAVPEPSSYAAACGVIALGATVWVRRRRKCADSLSR